MIPETRQAGRALDVEVAENVMGWQPLPGPSAATDAAFQRQYWETYGAEHRIAPSMGGFPSGAHRRVPHYSASLAEAWSIVEKMRADGWVFDLGSDGDAEWMAVFTRVVRRSDTTSGQATASTPALAICLAALASLPLSGDTRDA